MKRYILSLVMICSSIVGANAMDYETARKEALYLTDKMAYELNLNDQQYEDAYEINLDYLLSVRTAEDVTGAYLDYRLTDFRHILYDWQWNLFYAADYFLRPLAWHRGGWFFPIYSIYDRGYFFFHHPHVYLSYRGGHGHMHFHDGFYVHRRPMWEGGMRGSERGRIDHIAGRNGVRSNYVQGRGMNGHPGETRTMRRSETRSGSMERGRNGVMGRSTDRQRSGVEHNRGGIEHSRSSVERGRSSVERGRSGVERNRSTVEHSRSSVENNRSGMSQRQHGNSFSGSSTRSTFGGSRGNTGSSRGMTRGGSSIGSSSTRGGSHSTGGNFHSSSSTRGGSHGGGGGHAGGGRRGR